MSHVIIDVNRREAAPVMKSPVQALQKTVSVAPVIRKMTEAPPTNPEKKDGSAVLPWIGCIGGAGLAALGYKQNIDAQKSLNHAREMLHNTTDWGKVANAASMYAVALVATFGVGAWLNRESANLKKFKIEKGIV